jgi:hypothetical protein
MCSLYSGTCLQSAEDTVQTEEIRLQFVKASTGLQDKDYYALPQWSGISQQRTKFAVDSELRMLDRVNLLKSRPILLDTP